MLRDVNEPQRPSIRDSLKNPDIVRAVLRGSAGGLALTLQSFAYAVLIGFEVVDSGLAASVFRGLVIVTVFFALVKQRFKGFCTTAIAGIGVCFLGYILQMCVVFNIVFGKAEFSRYVWYGVSALSQVFLGGFFGIVIAVVYNAIDAAQKTKNG